MHFLLCAGDSLWYFCAFAGIPRFFQTNPASSPAGDRPRRGADGPVFQPRFSTEESKAMTQTIKGKAVIFTQGGPTAVINASWVGVVEGLMLTKDV